MYFEWDTAKERSNKAKHRIDFVEAATVFGDKLSITIHDPLHSISEERYVTMDMSDQYRLLVVVHSVRGDRIRIISARKATRTEKRNYESKG